MQRNVTNIAPSPNCSVPKLFCKKQRERSSKELHDAKSGKRNDDNYSYDDLKNNNFWDATIGALAVGAGVVLFVFSGGLIMPSF